ncbi:MAG: hypothetical protein ACRCYU_24105, partial [Nocardioides sp.]
PHSGLAASAVPEYAIPSPEPTVRDLPAEIDAFVARVIAEVTEGGRRLRVIVGAPAPATYRDATWPTITQSSFFLGGSDPEEAGEFADLVLEQSARHGPELMVLVAHDRDRPGHTVAAYVPPPVPYRPSFTIDPRARLGGAEQVADQWFLRGDHRWAGVQCVLGMEGSLWRDELQRAWKAWAPGAMVDYDPALHAEAHRVLHVTKKYGVAEGHGVVQLIVGAPTIVSPFRGSDLTYTGTVRADRLYRGEEVWAGLGAITPHYLAGWFGDRPRLDGGESERVFYANPNFGHGLDDGTRTQMNDAARTAIAEVESQLGQAVTISREYLMTDVSHLDADNQGGPLSARATPEPGARQDGRARFRPVLGRKKFASDGALVAVARRGDADAVATWLALVQTAIFAANWAEVVAGRGDHAWDALVRASGLTSSQAQRLVILFFENGDQGLAVAESRYKAPAHFAVAVDKFSGPDFSRTQICLHLGVSETAGEALQASRLPSPGGHGGSGASQAAQRQESWRLEDEIVHGARAGHGKDLSLWLKVIAHMMGGPAYPEIYDAELLRSGALWNSFFHGTIRTTEMGRVDGADSLPELLKQVDTLLDGGASDYVVKERTHLAQATVALLRRWHDAGLRLPGLIDSAPDIAGAVGAEDVRAAARRGNRDALWLWVSLVDAQLGGDWAAAAQASGLTNDEARKLTNSFFNSLSPKQTRGIAKYQASFATLLDDIGEMVRAGDDAMTIRGATGVAVGTVEMLSTYADRDRPLSESLGWEPELLGPAAASRADVAQEAKTDFGTADPLEIWAGVIDRHYDDGPPIGWPRWLREPTARLAGLLTWLIRDPHEALADATLATFGVGLPSLTRRQIGLDRVPSPHLEAENLAEQLADAFGGDTGRILREAIAANRDTAAREARSASGGPAYRPEQIFAAAGQGDATGLRMMLVAAKAWFDATPESIAQADRMRLDRSTVHLVSRHLFAVESDEGPWHRDAQKLFGSFDALITKAAELIASGADDDTVWEHTRLGSEAAAALRQVSPRWLPIFAHDFGSTLSKAAAGGWVWTQVLVTAAMARVTQPDHETVPPQWPDLAAATGLTLAEVRNLADHCFFHDGVEAGVADARAGRIDPLGAVVAYGADRPRTPGDVERLRRVTGMSDEALSAVIEQHWPRRRKSDATSLADLLLLGPMRVGDIAELSAETGSTDGASDSPELNSAKRIMDAALAGQGKELTTWLGVVGAIMEAGSLDTWWETDDRRGAVLAASGLTPKEARKLHKGFFKAPPARLKPLHKLERPLMGRDKAGSLVELLDKTDAILRSRPQAKTREMRNAVQDRTDLATPVIAMLRKRHGAAPLRDLLVSAPDLAEAPAPDPDLLDTAEKVRKAVRGGDLDALRLWLRLVDAAVNEDMDTFYARQQGSSLTEPRQAWLLVDSFFWDTTNKKRLRAQMRRDHGSLAAALRLIDRTASTSTSTEITSATYINTLAALILIDLVAVGGLSVGRLLQEAVAEPAPPQDQESTPPESTLPDLTLPESAPPATEGDRPSGEVEEAAEAPIAMPTGVAGWEEFVAAQPGGRQGLVATVGEDIVASAELLAHGVAVMNGLVRDRDGSAEVSFGPSEVLVLSTWVEFQAVKLVQGRGEFPRLKDLWADADHPQRASAWLELAKVRAANERSAIESVVEGLLSVQSGGGRAKGLFEAVLSAAIAELDRVAHPKFAGAPNVRRRVLPFVKVLVVEGRDAVDAHWHGLTELVAERVDPQAAGRVLDLLRQPMHGTGVADQIELPWSGASTAPRAQRWGRPPWPVDITGYPVVRRDDTAGVLRPQTRELLTRLGQAAPQAEAADDRSVARAVALALVHEDYADQVAEVLTAWWTEVVVPWATGSSDGADTSGGAVARWRAKVAAWRTAVAVWERGDRKGDRPKKPKLATPVRPTIEELRARLVGAVEFEPGSLESLALDQFVREVRAAHELLAKFAAMRASPALALTPAQAVAATRIAIRRKKLADTRKDAQKTAQTPAQGAVAPVDGAEVPKGMLVSLPHAVDNRRATWAALAVRPAGVMVWLTTPFMAYETVLAEAAEFLPPATEVLTSVESLTDALGAAGALPSGSLVAVLSYDAVVDLRRERPAEFEALLVAMRAWPGESTLVVDQAVGGPDSARGEMLATLVPLATSVFALNDVPLSRDPDAPFAVARLIGMGQLEDDAQKVYADLVPDTVAYGGAGLAVPPRFVAMPAAGVAGVAVDPAAVGEVERADVHKPRHLAAEAKLPALSASVLAHVHAGGQAVVLSKYEERGVLKAADFIREQVGATDPVGVVSVAHITGRTKFAERAELLGRFARGEVDVLVTTYTAFPGAVVVDGARLPEGGFLVEALNPPTTPVEYQALTSMLYLPGLPPSARAKVEVVIRYQQRVVTVQGGKQYHELSQDQQDLDRLNALLGVAERYRDRAADYQPTEAQLRRYDLGAYYQLNSGDSFRFGEDPTALPRFVELFTSNERPLAWQQSTRYLTEQLRVLVAEVRRARTEDRDGGGVVEPIGFVDFGSGLGQLVMDMLAVQEGGDPLGYVDEAWGVDRFPAWVLGELEAAEGPGTQLPSGPLRKGTHERHLEGRVQDAARLLADRSKSGVDFVTASFAMLSQDPEEVFGFVRAAAEVLRVSGRFLIVQPLSTFDADRVAGLYAGLGRLGFEVTRDERLDTAGAPIRFLDLTKIAEPALTKLDDEARD